MYNQVWNNKIQAVKKYSKNVEYNQLSSYIVQTSPKYLILTTDVSKFDLKLFAYACMYALMISLMNRGLTLFDNFSHTSINYCMNVRIYVNTKLNETTNKPSTSR